MIKNTETKNIDYFLDITAETCPLTFVRTKLLLEKMHPGETAEIHLCGTEPLENVPRSVTEHGHVVLSLEPEDPDSETDSVYRLIIRRQ